MTVSQPEPSPSDRFRKSKRNEIKALSGLLSIFRKKKAAPESGRKQPSAPAQKSEKKSQGKSSDSSRKKKRNPKRTNNPRKSHSKPASKKQVPAWDISQFVVPQEEGKTRFHDFDLPDGLMQGIHELGFKYCTPIQAEVLGSTLAGRDAIGKAQTGTGKTAAFLISTIKQLIDIPAPDTRYIGEPRAVVIAPTRELALQIGKDAEALTRHLPLNVVTVVGGMDYDKQRQKINANYMDILVATPGRLLDYCERKDLFLDLTETLIIDEADRMLDMGFIPQVRRIVRMTPRPGRSSNPVVLCHFYR